MKHCTGNVSTSQHRILLIQSHIVHHTHVRPARTHENSTMTEEVKIHSTGWDLQGRRTWSSVCMKGRSWSSRRS